MSERPIPAMAEHPHLYAFSRLFSTFAATHQPPAIVEHALTHNQGPSFMNGSDGNISRVKRVEDVVVSSAAIVAMAPAFLAIAAAIKLNGYIHPEDKGPVLFWQERIGRNGTIILIPKFRTMKLNADNDPNRMAIVRNTNPGDDPRATHFGRWLRKTPFDELPQILSIFMGDMTLVATRPTSIVGHKEMEKTMGTEAYQQYLPIYMASTAGLTGNFQISRYGHLKRDENRKPFDQQQYENDCLAYDMGILFSTVAYALVKLAAKKNIKAEREQRAASPDITTPTLNIPPKVTADGEDGRMREFGAAD